jgi:hypothetical protein
MTDTALTKQRRRWLRFSLRSLLLLVLVLCVALGWQVELLGIFIERTIKLIFRNA